MVEKKLHENFLKYAKVESDRFGMRIFRGTTEDIFENEILSTVINENVDIAILRIPSEKQFSIERLNRTGLPYIVADTLVYYYVDLSSYSPKKLRNSDLEFIECLPEHSSIVSELVSQIFQNYTNHYFSNSILNQKDILEGYKEWSQSYINARQEGRISWLVRKDGQFVGFATCSFDQIANEAEGVLYGVIPSVTGGGIYGDIIRFTQSYFKEMQFSSMKVSTQIQNFAVQKVWSREGFFLKNSYNTIHINSLMNYSKNRKAEIDICIRHEDILNYGDVSGDYNPIHFDDSYAKSKGFEKRIAHGILSNSILSKYYGMQFPGNGTIFMGYSYKFLRPLYLDREYKVQISFPWIDSVKGIYKSMVKVLDKQGNICLFSYNDLYKKN